MREHSRSLLCIVSTVVLWVGFQTGARAEETDLFTHARTLAAIRTVVEKAPADCFESRPDFMVCGWELSKRDSAWSRLAEVIKTRHPIGIVCELPRDGTNREIGSCRGWGRKRIRFFDALERGRRILDFTESASVENPPSQPSQATTARTLLDHARSIRSLSFVVGEPPHACLRRSAERQLCRWHLGNRSVGYELVAATINTKAAVTLSCPFRYDGTPLDPGTCQVRKR